MQSVDAPPERELIERTLAGDDAAFGDLVGRHQRSVFNIAYRMLGNREEANDAAQEAFWRAYRNLGGFDLDRPLGPWLYRIVTNLSLNRLRRNPPPTIGIDAPPAVPDASPGPPERLLQAETQNRIRRAILALPPPDRMVIELRHFQALSYEEIASVTGATVSSVKSRLFRARRRLQAQLADLVE
jgi:RNA polymerase sigma-70 factor (ECF subfamily)